MSVVALAVAEAVDAPKAIGAIDDHLPLHISPSGMTRERFPELPMMPSAFALKVGRGDVVDIGPSIGKNVAVVEQAHSATVRATIR
jgi:hypothetical protein